MNDVSNKEFYGFIELHNLDDCRRVVGTTPYTIVYETRQGEKIGEATAVVDDDGKLKRPSEYKYFLDEVFMESIEVTKSITLICQNPGEYHLFYRVKGECVDSIEVLLGDRYLYTKDVEAIQRLGELLGFNVIVEEVK